MQLAADGLMPPAPTRAHVRRMVVVDGTNIVRRCAWGDKIAPAEASATAVKMIRRLGIQLGATHLIVALDCPTPTLRKQKHPTYKANRTQDGTPYLLAIDDAVRAAGWQLVCAAGYEADDLCATLALRVLERGVVQEVVILSSDSDLLALASETVKICRVNPPEAWGPREVCEKYGLRRPAQLVDFKALVGEAGDNIAGVPKIGEKKAVELLARYESLEGIIAAGRLRQDLNAIRVYEHAVVAREARELVTLYTDVQLPPLYPRLCLFNADKEATG